MISPLLAAVFSAALMCGLLLEVLLFRALHDDPPSMYKLFAVRDMLVRLVVEGRIGRYDAHFEALYENVNILLKASRCISGPVRWEVAEAQGRYLARNPQAASLIKALPPEDLPSALRPVVHELRDALIHLVNNHFGILVQVDSRRREAARMQKEQAKRLLSMMSDHEGHPCPG